MKQLTKTSRLLSLERLPQPSANLGKELSLQLTEVRTAHSYLLRFICSCSRVSETLLSWLQELCLSQSSHGLAPLCWGQLDQEMQSRSGTLCWIREESSGPRGLPSEGLEGLQHKQSSLVGAEGLSAGDEGPFSLERHQSCWIQL